MIEENGGQTQRMNNTNEKFENEGKCFGRTLIRMVDLKRQLENEIEINQKMDWYADDRNSGYPKY